MFGVGKRGKKRSILVFVQFGGLQLSIPKLISERKCHVSSTMNGLDLRVMKGKK